MTDILNNETTEPVATGSGSSPTGNVGCPILGNPVQFPPLGGNVQPVSSLQKAHPMSSTKKTRIDAVLTDEQQLAIVRRTIFELQKAQIEELKKVEAELVQKCAAGKSKTWISAVHSTGADADAGAECKLSVKCTPLLEFCFGANEKATVRAMLVVMQSMAKWDNNKRKNNKHCFIRVIKQCIERLEIAGGTLNSTTIMELLMLIERTDGSTWIKDGNIKNFRAKPSGLKGTWKKFSNNARNSIIKMIVTKCNVSIPFVRKVIAEIDAFTKKAKKAKSSKAESVETKSVETESVETKSVETKSVETESVDTKSVDTKSVDTKSVETESVDTKSVETESVEVDVVEVIIDVDHEVLEEPVWARVGNGLNWNPPECGGLVVTNRRTSSIGHERRDDESVRESCYNYYNFDDNGDDNGDDNCDDNCDDNSGNDHWGDDNW